VRDLTRRPHPLVAVLRTEADVDGFLREHPGRRPPARRQEPPEGAARSPKATGRGARERSAR
jgi:hypothetical protein